MLDFIDARHVCSDAVVADIQVCCPRLRLDMILTNIHEISYSSIMVHHMMWAGVITVIDFVFFIDMLLAFIRVWLAIGGVLPLFASVFSLVGWIFTQNLQGQVHHMRVDSVGIELLERLPEGEILWHRLGQTSWLIKHIVPCWRVAAGSLLLFLNWVVDGPLAWS